MAGVLRMYTPSPSVFPTYTVLAAAVGCAALVGPAPGVVATGLGEGTTLACADGEAATDADDEGAAPLGGGVAAGADPVPGITPHPAQNNTTAGIT
jgi:hypothetical protein